MRNYRCPSRLGGSSLLVPLSAGVKSEKRNFLSQRRKDRKGATFGRPGGAAPGHMRTDNRRPRVSAPTAAMTEHGPPYFDVSASWRIECSMLDVFRKKPIRLVGVK